MSFNGSKTPTPRPTYAQHLDSTQHHDGWENFLTQTGHHHRDKRLASHIGVARIFNQRQELEQLFHGNDLAQRICTLIPHEMTREWICMTIEGTDEQNDVDLVKDVMQACDTLGVQSAITEAMTWARLFGGGCIYMGIDDGLDQSEPVNFDNIQSLRFLTVLDRHELRIVKRFADPLSPGYGEPELYEIVTVGDAMGVMAADVTPIRFGQRIHASRIVQFDGAPTTRIRKRRDNNGWSDSIFCRIFEVIRGYDNTWISAEQLMQDFSQAVIKIKGLAEMMAQQGEQKVRDRMEIMEASRSILRALMLDAEFEDFERKPTPMTGLPELLDRWLHRVSAAAEIPITLLFGMSPGGMNATGESDTTFFYNTIKQKQQRELRPQLEKFFKVMLRAKDGPTGGAEPESWSFNFEPLWQMSDTEQATVRKTQADTDAIYIDRGVLSAEEVAVSRFGGDEYSAETTLETTNRAAIAQAAKPAPTVTDPNAPVT